MVHDHLAVRGKTDIELQTVHAEGHRMVEGGHRVLGRERGAAAMREDERPG